MQTIELPGMRCVRRLRPPVPERFASEIHDKSVIETQFTGHEVVPEKERMQAVAFGYPDLFNSGPEPIKLQHPDELRKPSEK